MEIVATGRARAAVQRFYAALKADGILSSEGEVQLELTQPALRPARLGLGAKYVPHLSEGEAKVTRKIQASLRNARAEEGDNSEVQNVGSDDEESRTARIGKRKRRRKSGKDIHGTSVTKVLRMPADILDTSRNPKSENRRDEEEDMQGLRRKVFIPAASRQSLPAEPLGDKQTQETEGEDAADKRQPEHSLQYIGQKFVATQDQQKNIECDRGVSDRRQWRYAGLEVNTPETRRRLRRKQTRTRSRKKNLKRDRRAPSGKPAHLTQETLTNGRLTAITQKDGCRNSYNLA